ncbi:hypothetical protein [uncultured Tateyamaria sp.]|uniref:hypothetical protein n=1 Tax=Tateyamaria sp. 1078 TaxID=3417464 RepID=UPI00261B2209|nr:hypothetical protein [uncultured Tateyamaria sp.]
MNDANPDCTTAPLDEVFDAMCAGDFAMPEIVADVYPPFPQGRDAALNRHWITHAIHAHDYAVFDCVLARGVPVNVNDDKGYGPLTTLLEMEREMWHSLST